MPEYPCPVRNKFCTPSSPKNVSFCMENDTIQWCPLYIPTPSERLLRLHKRGGWSLSRSPCVNVNRRTHRWPPLNAVGSSLVLTTQACCLLYVPKMRDLAPSSISWSNFGILSVLKSLTSLPIHTAPCCYLTSMNVELWHLGAHSASKSNTTREGYSTEGPHSKGNLPSVF